MGPSPTRRSAKGPPAGHPLDLGTHTWEVRSNNRQRTREEAPESKLRARVQEEVWLLGGHAPLTLPAAGPAPMDLARWKPDPDLLKHRPWRERPGGNSLAGPWLGLCTAAVCSGLTPDLGTKVLQALCCSPKKKRTKHRP